MAKEIVRQVVDVLTGELVESTVSKTFTRDKDADLFLQLYVKGLSVIYDLKDGATIRVLFKILEMSDFKTMQVLIPSPIRKSIIERLDISKSSFEKAIRDLKSAGLIDGERGVYNISPEIFWCSTSQERDAILSGKTKCAITIAAIDSDCSF